MLLDLLFLFCLYDILMKLIHGSSLICGQGGLWEKNMQKEEVWRAR